MKDPTTRRDFARPCGIGASVSCALPATAASARHIRIGHTGITWGNDSPQAVKDISSLGYYGFETFGNVLEKWEADPELSEGIAACKLPLISAYCSFNLTDATKKKDEIDKMLRWEGLLKKFGGSVSVLGPNGVPRGGYNFKE
jgi:inosose dehydratase